MSLSRREFLILTTGAAALAATDGLGLADAASASVIDAGPVSNFATDGVYSNFRDLGFFVVRKGAKLTAFSSICPHRKYTLKA
jgi:hypothetical protein